MRSTIQRTNTQFALGYCQARETTCRADVLRMLDCASVFMARHLVLHAQHVLAVVLGNNQGKSAGKRGSGMLPEPTGSAGRPRGWQAVSSLATASVAVG